ncbi:DUF3325 domain-containing protein [Novosphingobium beihaiensis]|uniref:DUF3325 domain-containing protein n=1 Tax=Novosphingobium beihaiensis TaxID=2930389 RepID=A0ABT0BUW2_9SPHN|nr:DUF3325 domain-containing protein [Novosphingobium beihaiensis]MCJ2188822.1 DUF3325 domain-containing protein [Novosphingobium beihaiensis]
MSITHLAIFVLSLLGFAGLAIGTERYAPQLIGFKPAKRARKAFWILGWLLLAVALMLAALTLQTAAVGVTLWFGWLSLAGLALVFLLPELPWQKSAKAAPRRAPRSKAAAHDDKPARKSRHWIGLSLLAVTVAVCMAALLRVETMPLHRDDAIEGKAGPWSFALAEIDRDPPEVMHLGVPLKAYRIRFCETCDLDILRAYLKVNKPRALRASGVAFGGNRWDRDVEIQLPSNLTGDSELWLTVVGKDGSVHRTSWPMSRVSPGSVAWFEQQEKTR